MNRELQEATRAQNAAADPARSTFVSANAGSGKTTILTRRMARLLLAGVRPESILCLTFTKAASAEVQERIFSILGEWVLLDQDQLRALLEKIGEARISDQQLARARQLFAQALETPSGLKVQTIHAFCAGVLRRFPLEAGVPPDFREMDELESINLCYDAMKSVIEAEPELAKSMAQRRALDRDFVKIILSMRGNLRPEFDLHEMAQSLNLPPPMSQEAFIHALDQYANLDAQEDYVAQIKTRAHRGKDYILARRENEFDLDALQSMVFSTTGDFKKNLPAPESKFMSAEPNLAGFVGLIIDNTDRLNTEHYLTALRDLHRFADKILRQYQAEKSKRFLLDYDDLIEYADALLNQNDRLNWVMYRLDSRISHILVDEAQDTNEAQWRIIDALANATVEDQEHSKTLFVVGDEKQSIFSFQGANPDVFEEKRLTYRDALKDHEAPLQEEELLMSFRSSPVILDYVDQVFQGSLQAGLGANIKHRARADDLPGSIEILPYLWSEKQAAEAGWPAIDVEPQTSSVHDLAYQIADRIADDLKSGASLPTPDGARPVQPSDYLILLRKRDTFFYAVQKALLERQVPIAGVDKMKLNEELAVKDIMALLRVVQSPYDDLNLACYLRSPLAGLSERDLYQLAAKRGDLSLLEALGASDHQAVYAQVRDIQSRADFLRPHDLILRILRQHDGEAKLRARLGVSVTDALSGLLEKALQYETSETPSLIGFINWFDRQQIELRRVLSENDAAVRVMTIHGAKGLESSIVILPFIYSKNAPSDWVFEHQGLALTKGRFAPMPSAISELASALKTREEAEENRLLYVALTRARSKLIICGTGPHDDKSVDRFRSDAVYPDLIAAARALSYPKHEPSDGAILVEYLWPKNLGASAEPAVRPVKSAQFAPLCETDSRPKIGLSELLPEGPFAKGRGKEYGILFHELMEQMVKWPEAERGELARLRFGEAPNFEDCLAEAEAVLRAHPFLLTTQSTQEMTFVIAQNGLEVEGRMDHVAIGEDIVIVDYKTNLESTTTWHELNSAYQMQLAVYAHAMTKIAPNAKVRAMILWSKTADCLEPSSSQLQDAYANFSQILEMHMSRLDNSKSAL